jgi:hypothetical protein
MAVIHIYMEVSQGNSLCSYLKQAKMSFLFPFLYKLGEQEGKTSPAWGEVDTSGRGMRWGKDEYGTNTVHT